MRTITAIAAKSLGRFLAKIFGRYSARGKKTVPND